MTDNWISCSEQLPEKSMRCIFTIYESAWISEDGEVLTDEETYVVAGEVEIHAEDKRWWRWERDEVEFSQLNEFLKDADTGCISHILAWQPFPEPYKESEEN